MAFGLILAATANMGLASEPDVPVALSWTSPDALDLGFDEKELGALLDSYVQDVRDGKLPGANLMISRRGQAVLRASIGFADREDRAALSFDHLFRLYSMTKPIAAVLALQQIEAGLYGLDTAVGTFLPEFSEPLVFDPETGPRKSRSRMTVQHLLTHTAGFTAVWNDDAVARIYEEHGVIEHFPNEYENTPSSLSDFYRRIRALPLLHDPGTRRTYGVSNDVQGVLAERAGGSDVASILRSRLFDPLGMRETSFCVSGQDLARFASLYTYDEVGNLSRVEGGEQTAYECPAALNSLSGGLVGTISDYWRFAEALRRGGAYGEARILSPESVELLFAPQPNVDEGDAWIPGAEWGLSIAIVVEPSKSERTEVRNNVYWSGAANTSFWIDPSNELVALIFTQVRGSHPEFSIQTDFRNRVYSAFRGAKGGQKRF
ncbi:MAG: beta-lactamase family protein [Gammaproteobacteria bacterium]|nr:beta-lactamase family protein [Gammaproteobacteria bacterium]MYK37519.1 beta-lactamase family protein [Gammaproteobacteria bacterium]